MTWKKKTINIPAELEAELAKVRAAAPPPADPIYKYLGQVYRLRCRVDHSLDLQDAIKSEHSEHHPRTGKYYAGVIIELSAPRVTSKMKHKYITAIEYAHKEGIKPNDFVQFIKGLGGLNKCGALWRATYGRRTGQRQPKKKARH